MVPLLPYVEQNNVTTQYCGNVDFSDPGNAAVLMMDFPLMHCPSTPGASVVTYATTYISGGNASFAPPNAPGSKTNTLGSSVYPTTPGNVTGWIGDYAGIGQVKTVKDKTTSAEIGFANALVTVPWAGGGSKGATRQNGNTPLGEVTDGTSNTTLYSEACGRNMQYVSGYIPSPLPAGTTGAIWADSDNRITVTGTAADGSNAGAGPCVINCNNIQGDIFSFHVGGAQIAYADGHVGFISQNVSINILVSLVTKGGGEVVQVP
jgi:prepilin-type processing-associated H-X9-DG protein